MENPKYQVFMSAKNNEYYYRLRARNGEIILNGEGYTSKQNCLNGIASVRANSTLDSRYDRRDSFGNYIFNLKATNGEIIGRSENYTTSAGRENGIAAVKNVAPTAPVEEVD